MTRYIYECNSTSIIVDYQIASDGVMEFTGAKVLGCDYKPVGPCLLGLLNGLVLITKDGGTISDGVRILSLIEEEIRSECN